MNTMQQNQTKGAEPASTVQYDDRIEYTFSDGSLNIQWRAHPDGLTIPYDSRAALDLDMAKRKLPWLDKTRARL